MAHAEAVIPGSERWRLAGGADAPFAAWSEGADAPFAAWSEGAPDKSTNVLAKLSIFIAVRGLTCGSSFGSSSLFSSAGGKLSEASGLIASQPCRLCGARFTTAYQPVPRGLSGASGTPSIGAY